MIKKIVTNGCSWMEGMGVDDKLEDRLSALFAQKYNAKDINLSIPGGSNDRTLRTTIEWIFQNHKSRYFSETLVLIGLTQIHRNEVWYNTGELEDMTQYDSAWLRTSIHKIDDKDDKIFNKYMDLTFKYFHSYQYDYERTLRNIIQLASVCEYYGCKYFIFDALANLELWSLNGYKEVRDVVQDRHYDYSKKSLEDIIKSNPNIYLDITWDKFLGGVNSRFTQDGEFDASMRSPEWFEHHDEDDDVKWSDTYNKDGLYAWKDLGHPSTKGNYEWYKHLEKYIEKSKII